MLLKPLTFHILYLHHRKILSPKSYCMCCNKEWLKCLYTCTDRETNFYLCSRISCWCNTVHTNYFVQVGDIQQSNAINWSLADVHQKHFYGCSNSYILLLSIYSSSLHLTISIFTGYPVKVRKTEEDYTYWECTSSESTVDICRY